MYVWIIDENGNRKRTNIKNIIKKYNPYLISLSKKLITYFGFDRSIGAEDLHQELIVKLYFSLGRYNPEIASIKTYMHKICTNYLITKKKSLAQEGKMPTDFDGKILGIFSLSDAIDENLTLEDIIKGNELSPEDEIRYVQLIDTIKTKLNEITYCPTGFKPKLRSFVRVLFDTLFSNRKKFTKEILFKHRCRARYASRHNKKVPNKVVPAAKAVAEYLKVDIRAINLGMRIIKKTIKKHSKT
jgi:DNA-directed RNA polymerase specialized sigma24 family protein